MANSASTAISFESFDDFIPTSLEVYNEGEISIIEPEDADKDVDPMDQDTEPVEGLEPTPKKVEPVEEELVEEPEDEAEIEDENSEEYKVALHRGLAKAFAQKFNFDLDEDKITDIDSLGEVFEQISDLVIEAKWDTVKNTNEKVQAVLDILEQGGDIKEIANLYKQEEELFNIDISDAEGKVKLISSYYKKELNWTDERIKRHLSKIDDEDLDEEATTIKDEYQKLFKAKQEKIVEKEKLKIQTEEAKKKEAINSIGQFMTSKNYKKEDINDYLKYAYQDAYKLGNETLTKLDFALLEVRKQPEKFINLIEFLKDEEKFINSKIAEKTTKKTETTFKKVLESQVNKKTGNTTESTKVKIKPIEFKF